MVASAEQHHESSKDGLPLGTVVGGPVATSSPAGIAEQSGQTQTVLSLNLPMQELPTGNIGERTRPAVVTLEMLWDVIQDMNATLDKMSRATQVELMVIKTTQENFKAKLDAQDTKIKTLDSEVQILKTFSTLVSKEKNIQYRKIEHLENQLRKNNLRILNFPKSPLIAPLEMFKKYLKETLHIPEENLPPITKTQYISGIHPAVGEAPQMNLTEFLQDSLEVITERTTMLVTFAFELDLNGESCSLQERPSSRASFCPSSKTRRRLMQEGPETQREKKHECFVQETAQESKGQEHLKDSPTDKCIIPPSTTHVEIASCPNSSVKPENCDDYLEDSCYEVCGRPSTPEPWVMKLPHRPISSKNAFVPQILHLYLPNLSPEEDEERKPNKRGDLIKDIRDTALGGNSGRSQQEGHGVTPLFQHISGPSKNLEMRTNGYKVKLAPKQPESKKLLSRPHSAKEKYMMPKHPLHTANFILHFMSPEGHVWSPSTYSSNVRGSSNLNKEEQVLGLEDLLKESDDIRMHQSENHRLIKNGDISRNNTINKHTKNILKIKTLEFGSDEPPNTRMISVMQSDHFNDHDLWSLLSLV
ncbi:uncharacterized protein LOC115472532 [Microcaecilia unicolor]|uniref:Uncharacterized protein LOC115472532 n=1 Tax=Microcaecilia unicolor TaxID=1415580 RepID=A0A6P7YCM7_9AMPH|nr:uncharacterized protein LOC115472532 [Microcaecilia unicolor]